MLARILQGLLDHPQERRLAALREPLDRRRQVGLDDQAGEGGHVFDRVADRAVQPQLVQQRRSKPRDEAAYGTELPAKELSQEAQLPGRLAGILFEDPLDVLDL